MGALPPDPTLAWFLQQHPWDPALLAVATPVEAWMVLDLDAPRTLLWPQIMDTSTFNRRLGFGEMKFTEKGGRLQGTAVNGGMEQAWDEVPWEWTEARELHNARVFSRGWAHHLRGHYLLDDLPGGRTRMCVYFGWIPRGSLARPVLNLGAAFIASGYRRVMNEIVDEVRAREKGTPPPVFVAPMAPPPLSPEAEARLREKCTAITQAGVPAPLVEKLDALVRTEPDDDVFRIRPRMLARTWGVRDADVLRLLLHATRSGLTTFSWDVVCPHCRGVRQEVMHLGELPRTGECEACGVTFDATQSNALEVTFHVHPSIRGVERHWFCAAEPARRPHIMVQQTVPAGAEREVDPPMAEGRYRLRVLGNGAWDTLDVLSTLPAQPVMWHGRPSGRTFASGVPPSIVLSNSGDTPLTFVLERTAENALPLRPADLFLFPQFRDLFSEEAVAADIQLDVGTRTLLFTDLVGSTRFYEQEGDSVAFAHVRRHFVTAYAAVEKHGGTVVKTIGDAVMAAFATPAHAVAAAVELQRHFNGKNPATPLRIRVSIHAGPCLAVKLNTNIDLFGSTVNMAAKLQAVAEAGQVSFSRAVLEDPGVVDLLAREGLVPTPVHFPMKWSGASITVHRVDVE